MSGEGRKSERLLNLLIMLLVQRRFVTKERIREILYPDASSEAFEKMFERDKEELRSLGVPIEVGNLDAYFDDEPGYRIPAEELALPDIELTPDEASVVGLATKVWQHARLAAATTEGVRKLAAHGVEVDLDRLDIASPRLAADEPAFDALWDATVHRTPVRFDYRRADQPEPASRRVQPWGVVRHAGRWYVVGFDIERQAERVFRLSRVQGKVKLDGPPDSFQVPQGTDIREIAQRLVPARPTGEMTIVVRAGRGAALRRAASGLQSDVPGPDDQTAWDRLTLPTQPIDELLGYGADLVLEEPAQARSELISRLRSAVAGHRGVRSQNS